MQQLREGSTRGAPAKALTPDPAPTAPAPAGEPHAAKRPRLGDAGASGPGLGSGSVGPGRGCGDQREGFKRPGQRGRPAQEPQTPVPESITTCAPGLSTCGGLSSSVLDGA